jgi:hypothetical protein
MKEMEQKNHEESKSMERPEESIRRFVRVCRHMEST